MKSTTLLIAAAILLGGCKSSSNDNISTIDKSAESTNSVIQPIAGLGIKPTVYTVISENGAEIKLPNGGKITIPKGAFANKDGNTVSGTVDLEWQEFHSLTDIMLSGIPMKYDSAGVEFNLVSGGMFTINANKNGEKLFLKDGKEIDVNLVSTDDTPCYNFYELDDKTGDWKYETTAEGTPVVSEVETKKEVPNTKTTLIDCEVEYSQFPELKDKNIVAWSTKEELSLEELRTIKNQVALLTLQKDDEGFYLNFKRNKEGTKLRVTPYLLEEAAAKSKTLETELNKDYVAVQNAVQSAFQGASNGQFQRNISISNFGTYNWDCIHMVPDAQPIVANFKYNNEVENTDAMQVYYICKEDNLIVRCNSKGDNSFFYAPTKKNALVAIAPNKEVFLMDNTGFDILRSNFSKKEHTFYLKSTGILAENGHDVGEIVKSVL